MRSSHSDDRTGCNERHQRARDRSRSQFACWRQYESGEARRDDNSREDDCLARALLTGRVGSGARQQQQVVDGER